MLLKLTTKFSHVNFLLMPLKAKRTAYSIICVL